MRDSDSEKKKRKEEEGRKKNTGNGGFLRNKERIKEPTPGVIMEKMGREISRRGEPGQIGEVVGLLAPVVSVEGAKGGGRGVVEAEGEPREEDEDGEKDREGLRLLQEEEEG